MTSRPDTESAPEIERRDFFKLGARKAAHVAHKLASDKARARAQHWIRPPFALDELDFLLTCTRCADCIEACPHDVLFPLAPRLGVQVTGTPAMDLLAIGCHMCADWPCVNACAPRALAMPEQSVAKFAVVGIDTAACLPYSGPECGACADACPVPGALAWDGGIRPVINEELCTGCALCREACIVDPKAITVSTLAPEHDASKPDRITNRSATGTMRKSDS